MPSPPRLAGALLRLVLSREDAEVISGDLEETFHARFEATSRPPALWYWRQVFSVLFARMWKCVPTLASQPPERQREKQIMATLQQDLAFALRSLCKNPGFTTTAIVMLALGIGANVAMFALANAVMLKPLPFANPNRLMVVHMLAPDRDTPGILRTAPWSYPKYVVFRDQQAVFDSTALFAASEWNITGTASPERVSGESVGASYFPLLGIPPSVGRTFTTEEAHAPGSSPIVILGHALWQRRFGGDPAVLGRSLGLGGVGHTIVGVAPPGFHGMTGHADLWVPVTVRSADELGEAWNHSFELVVRLKPGVTYEIAESATKVLGARVDAQYAPGGWRPGGSAGEPRWSAAAVRLDDERIDPVIRRSILLMLVAVGSLLLIVCLNLANLTFVRTLDRRQEVAICLALGASRLRIVRHLMTESVVLAIAGTLAGIGVAYAAIVGGAAMLPDLGRVLPRETAGLTRVGLSALDFDWRTLLFILAAAASTATLFGLGPAWRISRRDLSATMRISAVVQGGSHLRVRNALVALELALALVLLCGGGLMIKSVMRLQSTSLGIDPASVLTFRLVFPGPQYDAPRATNVLVQLLGRLEQLPGTTALAYGSCAPVSGPCNRTTASFPGRPPAERGQGPMVGVYWASPRYFEALGIRLVKGRVFAETDRAGQPKVVVVNETAARTFWGADDPIGKRIAVGQGGFGSGAEVVGVVADVRYAAVEASVIPDVYLPLLESFRTGGVIFIRSGTMPERLVPMIRGELAALDPDLPLTDVKKMDDRFGGATWRPRTIASLLGAFASLAVFMAALGIYGVMSQGVKQRTRGIGVRLALGARREDIVRLVVGRAAIVAVAGVALGVALTIPAARLLTTLLYQVSPGDPVVLATLAAVLLAVALVAGYAPARRATLVDPLITLRGE